MKRMTILVAAVLVMVMIIASVRPAYAHNDHDDHDDYDTIAVVVVVVAAILVGLFAAGVFQTHIESNSNDRIAPIAMVPPDEVMREKAPLGYKLAAHHPNSVGTRTKNPADMETVGRIRFGLKCPQLSLVCW